jgi:alpha-L-rhamnosidase
MTSRCNSNYLDNYITAYRLKYLDAEGNVLSSTADGITQYGRPQNNIVIDNSQTALLWALKLELYENEEQKQVMIDNLLANIANEGGVIRPDQEENTLSVGFLGVNVLLPVLTDIGMADVAYDLLLQDAMPSWLYSVKNGATTIWERWNSYSVENSFGDSGMNSFNHYSYGAVVEWMMGYMSGIIQDQENPGYQNFILQPTIDESGRITYVNGSYKSLYGTIESNWTAQSGNLKSYSAVVPANTSAELYLPISE